MTDFRNKDRPIIAAWGASLTELREVYPNYDVKKLRELLYGFCVRHCLNEIGRVMYEYWPDENITFIHDHGQSTKARHSLFKPAQQAFLDAKEDPDPDPWIRQFVSFAPMSWQNCLPLQPADMIAYDAFKVIDKRLHVDENAIRRSLEAIHGKDTQMVVGYIKPGGIVEMHKDFMASMDNQGV
jgi:hypothetical protein